MESDIDVAIEELEKIQFMLEDYQDSLNSDHQQHDQQDQLQERFDLLQPVILQATIDPAHAPVRFQSTFGRELWFCSLHAVSVRERARGGFFFSDHGLLIFFYFLCNQLGPPFCHDQGHLWRVRHVPDRRLWTGAIDSTKSDCQVENPPLPHALMLLCFFFG